MSFILDGFEDSVPVSLVPSITKDQLLNFKAFNIWAETLKLSLARQKSDSEHPFHAHPYKLRSITIQSVNWFGPRIGFIMMSTDITNGVINKDGKEDYLPGVVFLRGGSVAMLIILRPSDSRNERWVVMTEQPRIPAGSLSFMEIPAGMVDNAGSLVLAARKEIEEETGLDIPQDELKNLTDLALREAKAPEKLQDCMYPSPGGSDEFIGIFLWEKVMDRQEIESLKGKLTGLRRQGEKITVRILNYEELWKVGARDAKTLAAWSLYEACMEKFSFVPFTHESFLLAYPRYIFSKRFI